MFVTAGLLFQFLTLVQPALVIGVPYVVVLWLGSWAPRRRLEPRYADRRQTRDRTPTDAYHANAGERTKTISMDH